MKLTICATTAIALSLIHFFVKGEDSGPSKAAALENNVTSEIRQMLSISNYTDAGSTFAAIIPTQSNIQYQAFYSTDQENWQKHGEPFSGNGSLRVLSFDKEETGNPTELLVSIHQID